MRPLATLVRDGGDAILRRWRDFPRDVPIRMARVDDRVRTLLGEVADALASERTSVTGAVGEVPLPGEPQSDFDLDTVLREFRLLRECIFDAVEEAGVVVDLAEFRILTDVFAYAIARAATEHRRQLRDSEAELRLVTDALPVLVSFVTADERYRFVNRAYEEWFGVPREQVVGRTLREFLGETAYEKLRPYVRRGLSGERFDLEHLDVPYRHGGTRDISVSYVPHRAPSGTVDGYIALIEDITARRRLEAERERLARQSTEVLESMGDGFFAVDAAWRIVTVNQRYEQLSGKRREESVGRVLWELFPRLLPDSVDAEGYRRCMEQRVDSHFTIHRDAPETWTDVRAYPTADGGIAVFFRDVTAERRAEEALARQAQFEQQLIGIVSHDLRNPLNVIALASAALTESDDLGPKALKTLVRMKNAAARAARMVRDLLDFTQARLAGAIPIEPRRANLHSLVGAVMDEMDAAFPDREVDVRHEGDGAGHFDPDRIAQVVQNLVTNALKYSPPESPVRVLTRSEAEAVTLLVHNGGPPIPAEKLSVIFEPLQRAVNHVERAGRSVGLGLYIVKKLVEAHGGTVSVSSSEAEGTTFSVRLPRPRV